MNDSVADTPHVLKPEGMKVSATVSKATPAVKPSAPQRPKETTTLDRPSTTQKPVEKEDEVDIKTLLKTMRQQQKEEERPAVANVVKEEPAPYTAPPKAVAAEPVIRMDFTKLQVTGTLFNTYITATDGQFFYLIDQHAAHERVFYEQLLAQYQMEEKPAQLLMIPVVKEVTPAIQALAEQWLDVLRGYGFTVEEFGQRSYVVKAIPMMMEQSEAADFLDYFFDNIEEGFRVKDQKRIDQIIMRSCKQAVKANDVLKPEEITGLLRQLSTMENPFSCPHGRPTFIKFSKYEIEKMFKRV
ncbi:MAG: hypothetical protein IJ486_07980 [Firmicutes bacterium]|nr:hypothetical protein [Bacillota bacterium]